MDPSDPETKPASWYVANLDAKALARYIREFGEEPAADLIAERLAEFKPRTTRRTVGIIVECKERFEREVRGRRNKTREGESKIHPATKTFQALRMLVNKELDSIHALLAEGPRLLKPGGLFCAISFHTVEDDAVRTAMCG